MRICSIFEDSPGHEEVSYGCPEKLRNFWQCVSPPPVDGRWPPLYYAPRVGESQPSTSPQGVTIGVTSLYSLNTWLFKR